MIYVDKQEDVRGTREQNQGEAVTLRTPWPAPWLLWTPNAERPIKRPNGYAPTLMTVENESIGPTSE